MIIFAARFFPWQEEFSVKKIVSDAWRIQFRLYFEVHAFFTGQHFQ